MRIAHYYCNGSLNLDYSGATLLSVAVNKSCIRRIPCVDNA
jgi:hypothetical protein